MIQVSLPLQRHSSHLSDSSRILYPSPTLFKTGSYPSTDFSFLLSDDICTLMEPLKLSTDASQTCSISSSWLTGLPRLRRRYSRIPFSFSCQGNHFPFCICLASYCIELNFTAFQAYILLHKFSSCQASDTCLKFLQMKRFFHIIVCTCIQSFNLIGNLSSCR